MNFLDGEIRSTVLMIRIQSKSRDAKLFDQAQRLSGTFKISWKMIPSFDFFKVESNA